jgi:hypothetical protein
MRAMPVGAGRVGPPVAYYRLAVGLVSARGFVDRQ